jgi:[ribosomal protein S5]-alanine N-acetyltransferase
LAIEDAERTFRWRHEDRAVYLNTGAPTVNAQAEWISARPATELNFIIELKNGSAVGMLSLIEIDTFQRRAETARFLIGEEEAVRGIPAAVEAMFLLYEFAFNELNLHRIYGQIAAENEKMIKWQLYLGMKEEGRLRMHYYINGHFQDAVCMGILVNEYRADARAKMKILISAGRMNK